MSIDLGIEPARPISIRPLLPRIAEVLAEILHLATPPVLALARIEGGQELPVVDDTLVVDGAPLLVLSIAGEPEAVALLGLPDSLTVSMSGRQSCLKYALGAAAAIAIARTLHSQIEDDRQFFGPEIDTSPEVLLKRLRVVGPHDDYRAAARKIQWGPRGPTQDEYLDD